MKIEVKLKKMEWWFRNKILRIKAIITREMRMPNENENKKGLKKITLL